MANVPSRAAALFTLLAALVAHACAEPPPDSSAARTSALTATRYEAESATTNLPTETRWSGFSGASYLCCWGSNGQYATFHVDAPSAGTYVLSFGYSAGSGAATRRLTVNGASLSAAQSFPATASWTTWARLDVRADLAAGANTITLVWDSAASSGNWINLDYLDVTPVAAPATHYEAESATTNLPTETRWSGFSGASYLCCWGSNGQYATFTVNVATAGAYQLAFRYSAGNGDATRKLLVNGVPVAANQTFPRTVDWNTWSSLVVTATLAAGSNAVTLTWDTASGSTNWINLDALDVQPASTPPPPPPPPPPSGSPCATPSATGAVTRVTDLGATPDDSTDDTAALQRAIDGSASAGTVDFGAGVYLVAGTLTFRSGRTYLGHGTATLRATSSAGFLATTEYDATHDLVIDGVTFDGRGFAFAGSGGAKAARVAISNCTFRNVTSTVYPQIDALYVPIGMTGSDLGCNHFAAVRSVGGAALQGWHFDNTVVHDNVFDGVEQCISLKDSGSNLTVARNVGTHLHRMGIELQDIDPGATNIVVDANRFSDWTDPYYDSFGLSIVPNGATSVRITNNVLDARATASSSRYGYGIEVSGTETVVQGNVLRGPFWYGIVCAGSNDHVNGNTLCGIEPGHEIGSETGGTFTVSGNVISATCP